MCIVSKSSNFLNIHLSESEGGSILDSGQQWAKYKHKLPCSYVSLEFHFLHCLHVFLLSVYSVRVSNELGKARPRAAMYSVYVTIVESLILGLIFMVLIFFVKDYFAVIFTSSVAVQKYVSTLAYLLGITMVLNSVQPVISGELKISLSLNALNLISALQMTKYCVSLLSQRVKVQ